jgi:hypothetical protein
MTRSTIEKQTIRQMRQPLEDFFRIGRRIEFLDQGKL